MQNLPEPHAPRESSGGMSGLTIALIVLGVFGVGFMVACGGFFFVMMRATAEMEEVFEEVAMELESNQAVSASLQVLEIDSALQLYRLEVGTFPTTEQGLEALLTAPEDLPNPDQWNGPYLDNPNMLIDPWGSPYEYRIPSKRAGESFDVWSLGPDGLDDTEDDISN